MLCRESVDCVIGEIVDSESTESSPGRFSVFFYFVVSLRVGVPVDENVHPGALDAPFANGVVPSFFFNCPTTR